MRSRPCSASSTSPRRHERLRARWRLLSPLAQAVLVIAFLRTNMTCAELAAGFGISPVTCWRNIREGISVLADRGRRISLEDVARLAVKMGWDYLTVDGVHVPTVTLERENGRPEGLLEVATGYAGIRTRCAVLTGQRSVESRLKALVRSSRW